MFAESTQAFKASFFFFFFVEFFVGVIFIIIVYTCCYSGYSFSIWLLGTVQCRLGPQDPYSAALLSLYALGWELVGPKTIRTHDGQDFELDAGSPACLRSFVRRRYEWVLVQRVADRYDIQEEMDFLPFRRVLRKMSGKERRCVLRALSGTFLTQDVLEKWGFQVPRVCPHCQVEPDCLCHRLSTCEFEPAAAARKELFDQEVVDAWAADGPGRLSFYSPKDSPNIIERPRTGADCGWGAVKTL